MFISVKTKGGTAPDSNTHKGANLTRGVEGFAHKLYLDNVFPFLTYVTTWHRRNVTVVGRFGCIERACPRTSNPEH
jgi:hypothetical protein